MTFQYKGGSNRTLFDSPADWVSPNPAGGYRDNPPDMKGKKVVLTDTDHLWGIGGSRAWVWKSFTRGLNPLFMDPYAGAVIGGRFEKKWDPIRQGLGQVLRLSRRLDLAAMTPHNTLASTRFCLADPGRAYVVFLPDGGKATVDLTACQGKLDVEWLDPAKDKAHPADPVDGGAKRTLTAPFKGEAVVYVHASR
jgi:hypothetical protein